MAAISLASRRPIWHSRRVNTRSLALWSSFAVALAGCGGSDSGQTTASTGDTGAGAAGVGNGAGNGSGNGSGNGTGSGAGNGSGGGTSTGSGGASSSTGAGGAGGGPPVDACAGMMPACPTAPNGFTEGNGLAAIDRCAFPLAQGSLAAQYAGILTGLAGITTPATIGDLIADTDRTAVTSATVPGAPPGLAYAFKWNAEDEASTRWFPQGITGTADASATGEIGGKKIVAVSFYDNGTGSYEKGVRIAFADVTTPSTPKYRFALLAEPVGSMAAPDLAPVKIHAGGIVWIGNLLYVVETGKGFRVFDMAHLLRVATDVDAIGCTGGVCHAGLYKYVVPQIDAFHTLSACSPIFSYVSLDRSSSPPSLLSGEYCSTTACSGPLAGRIYRWPLDPTTGRLAAGTSWPSEAFLMGQRQVQGGASKNGLFFLSSSAPPGSGGDLYRVTTQKSATSNWADSPEDLMIDPLASRIWSLSEGVGSRYVFSAALASYPAP